MKALIPLIAATFWLLSNHTDASDPQARVPEIFFNWPAHGVAVSKAPQRAISCKLTGEILYKPLSGGRSVQAAFTVLANASNYCIMTHAVSDTNYHWTVFNVASNVIVQSLYQPALRHDIAEIKPLPAPVKCPDQASHFLWVALTPSIHTDDEGRVILPPVYNASADIGTNPQLRRKCLVEYLDESRAFIKRVRFFNEGTFNQFSKGENSAHPYPKPYDKGFMEANFETLGTTNWDGLTIPIRIEGEIFRPGDGSSRENLKISERIEISVSTVEALEPGTVLPPPVKPDTLIGDRRIYLKPNQPLTYTLNGGAWPDEATARQAAQDVESGPRPEIQPLAAAAGKSPLTSVSVGNPFNQIFTNLGSVPFRLSFTGIVNGAYYVIASTNLTRWQMLGPAVQLENNHFQFIDFGATNFPHRYYQIHAR